MFKLLKRMFSRDRLEGGVVVPVDLVAMNNNLLVLTTGEEPHYDFSDVIGAVAVERCVGPVGRYRTKVTSDERKIRIELSKRFPLFKGDSERPYVEICKESGAVFVKHVYSYDLDGVMYMRVVRDNYNRRRA